MKRRARILLCVTMRVAVVLLASAVGWVVINSRDVAPVDTSDLIPNAIAVSDDENADTCFRQAFQSFHWPKDERKVRAMLEGETWDDALVRDLLSRNAQALALLKQGLAREVYQALDVRGPNELRPFSKLSMSSLIALNAAHERRTGQQEQAWNASRDLLRFGALIVANPAGIIDCAEGMVILERGLEQAERSLCEPASGEAHLVSLSDHLSHMVSLERAWTHAIKKEHAFVTAILDKSTSTIEAKHHVVGRYMLQPNRVKADFAHLCRTMVQNLSRPYAEMDLPEAAESMPGSVGGLRRFLTLLRPNGAAKLVMPARDYLNRFLFIRCRTQSHLDGLRLAVACRLYEIRHGQLPETLDVLVPELFKEVPRDTFDGKPFRYVRENAVVYSVGRNLKDSWSLGDHADDLVCHIHGKSY